MENFTNASLSFVGVVALIASFSCANEATPIVLSTAKEDSVEVRVFTAEEAEVGSCRILTIGISRKLHDDPRYSVRSPVTLLLVRVPKTTDGDVGCLSGYLTEGTATLLYVAKLDDEVVERFIDASDDIFVTGEVIYKAGVDLTWGDVGDRFELEGLRFSLKRVDVEEIIPRRLSEQYSPIASWTDEPR